MGRTSPDPSGWHVANLFWKGNIFFPNPITDPQNGPRLYKLPLYGAVIATLTTGKGVRFGFSVKAEDRSEFVFSSTNEEIAREWMEVVEKQKANIESALSSITI